MRPRELAELWDPPSSSRQSRTACGLWGGENPRKARQSGEGRSPKAEKMIPSEISGGVTAWKCAGNSAIQPAIKQSRSGNGATA
jgi:hypothetical protein